MRALLRDALGGAIAGADATWAMDQVTTLLYLGHARDVTEQEEAAQPNGKSSVANLVDRIQAMTGIRVPERRRALVQQAGGRRPGEPRSGPPAMPRRTGPVTGCRAIGYSPLLAPRPRRRSPDDGRALGLLYAPRALRAGALHAPRSARITTPAPTPIH